IYFISFWPSLDESFTPWRSASLSPIVCPCGRSHSPIGVENCPFVFGFCFPFTHSNFCDRCPNFASICYGCPGAHDLVNHRLDRGLSFFQDQCLLPVERPLLDRFSIH